MFSFRYNSFFNLVLITGPKESTLGDFWEMVCQDQVKQIIMLTNLREGRKVSYQKCIKIETSGGFLNVIDEFFLVLI